MTPRHSLRWPGTLLVLLGLLAIGLWAKNATESRGFHSAEAKPFAAARSSPEFAQALAERLPNAPWCPATLESGVFGRIVIPRLGISALIAEGAESAQLDRVVGHVATTVLPGQSGNCALAGHRDRFLRGLGQVRRDDIVLIDTLQDTYTYRVEWGAVVGPGGADVLDPTAMPSLTLVAWYPFDDVGPASERFVVRARLLESTRAAR